MERPGAGQPSVHPLWNFSGSQGAVSRRGSGGAGEGDTVAAPEASERNRGNLEGTQSTSSFLSPYPCLPCVGSLRGAQERGAEAQPARRSGGQAGSAQTRTLPCVASRPESRARGHASTCLPLASHWPARGGGGGLWPLALILVCETAQCPRL